MAAVQRVVLEGFGYEMLIVKPSGVEFEKLFDARRSALRDFSEPLSEFGAFIVDTHIPYQFSAQGAPTPWANLSPQYALQKLARWGLRPILVASGAMYHGFSYRATRFSLNILNTQERATYHQTGTVKMPARPWLQMRDDSLGYGELRRLMKEHVLGSYGVTA